MPAEPPPCELLESLGMDPATAGIYLAVVEAGEVSREAFGADGAALDDLARVGLVRLTDDSVVATPVRLAVERWVVEQEARISRARESASQFALRQQSLTGGFLELVRDTAEVRRALEHLLGTAVAEIRGLEREPFFRAPTARWAASS